MGSAVFEISLAASRSAWLRDHARTAKREPRDSSFFHRNIPIRGINEKKRFLEQIPVAKFIFSCDSTTRRRWPIRARVTLAAIFGESSVRSLRARNYRAMFAERYSKNKAARSSSPRFSFRTDSESTTSEYVRLCHSCEPTDSTGSSSFPRIRKTDDKFAEVSRDPVVTAPYLTTHRYLSAHPYLPARSERFSWNL